MANFRLGGFPPVTPIVKNLIIINALMFALRYVLQQKGIDLDAYLGLHYWQSPLFRWWQPITHIFMHGSLEHILFNMLALYMFGSMLESFWGHQRFLLFYFICGVGAALCYMGVLTFEYTRFHSAFMYYQEHPTFVEYAQFIKHQNLYDSPIFSNLLTFWNANPNCGNCAQKGVELINDQYTAMMYEPMVGASGAIMGLLFAFGYLFPNTILYLYFAVPVKAKWFVAGYAVLELFLGVRNSAGDNVAHFAHLGGMLFAFILLRIWNNKIRNRFY